MIVTKSSAQNSVLLHEVVDENGNLIYKIENTPAAIKTGVTADDGLTGTAEVLAVVDGTSAPGMIRNDRMSPSTNISDTKIPENADGVKTDNTTEKVQNSSNNEMPETFLISEISTVKI